MKSGESSHHTVCNKVEPVLYEDEDFKQLTRDVNSVVAELPRDFLRFDFTTMEDPLRKMVYCSDKRMEQGMGGENEWEISHVKTEKESEIDEYLEESLDAVDMKAYLGERLLTSDLPMIESEKEARLDVQSLGPSFMRESENQSGEVHMGKEK